MRTRRAKGRSARLGALVLLTFLASCNKSSAPTGSGTTNVGTKESRLTLDADLISSGRVRVETAARRAPSTELRVAGDVVSSDTGAAEAGALVPGRVAAILVTEGAHVKQGQVLAWVDAPEVGRATAEVLRARARASVAARKLERQGELDKQEATSKNALDEARAEGRIASADLAAARTLLLSLGGQEPPDNAETSPTSVPVRLPVRAPIDGVVAHREAVLGGAVSPDRPLFRLVAASRVAVLARVPETIQDLPKEGAHATITSRGAPKDAPVCSARVTGVLGAIDEATRTLPLRLEPDPTCTLLVPGAYVEVVLAGAPTQGKPEIVVPREAVLDVHGVPSVFVAEKTPGAFVLRPVRARFDGGPDAVIESGLAEGEGVASTGALLLKGELLRGELESP